MEMIYRNAAKKDFAALKKIFRSWAECDSEICELLEAAFSRDEKRDLRCGLVEAGKTIRAASLWYYEVRTRCAWRRSGPGRGPLSFRRTSDSSESRSLSGRMWASRK